MSRRFVRLSLIVSMLLASEVWAIGLGDINLDSALNEPLRAEIILLSATPEELNGLRVALASADDFERYGIERPFYLQELEFNVVRAGENNSVVQIRSRSPITEPFLTFLVEATWSSGRLLREYTVLLDPPTYAPPAVQQTPAVTAPQRTQPSDSARIDRRPEPQPQPTVSAPARTQPAPQPAQPPRAVEPEPDPEPAYTPPPAASRPADSDSGYATSSAGDVYVERGDTLWGIARRMRPDSRLSMNQTMLAIYESNREAFGNNINILRAGATLRIPSADDIFQISRADATSEVRRQNNDWGYVDSSSADVSTDTSFADSTDTDTSYADLEPTYADPEPDYVEPVAEPQPSLVLVPPDEEPAGSVYDDDATSNAPLTREQEIENRIAELEAADVPNQQSLIEIRDSELAALRQELAEIRGETLADDAATEPMDELVADDAATTDDTLVEDPVEEPVDTTPTEIVSTQPADDESIVDTILGYLSNTFVWIGAAVVVVLGLLFAFMRRRGDNDEYDNDRPWETLDDDEMAAGAFAGAETISTPAPSHEDSIVVVEQDSGVHPILDEDANETVEAPAPELPAADEDSQSGQFGSLEDTFSSETAVNLDQTDPIAEADFHMAYGLYDQAADLITGALETDPSDKTLMSKLCEIYFVWGNRDAFIDAASRLNMASGDGDTAEWNKIVIMGQQIAADHELFAGAEVAGATEAVDLSFDEGGDDAGALDMDFGAEDAGASDIVDLGADEDTAAASSIDFAFDDEGTAETPTIEADPVDKTAEMPAPTVETPTIEEQFSGFGGNTSELPSLDESLGQAISESGQDADETAEINLDELDLNIDSNAETELASLDDLDITGTNEALDDTGINEALDPLEATGKNPEVDPDETGIREALDTSETSISEALDLDELAGLTGDSGLNLAVDETGQSPALSVADEDEATDVGLDDSLLDATGMTQVLTEDMAVATGTISGEDATLLAPADDESAEALADDAETMLASLDDDEEDFDFAKTEALPSEAFDGGDLDATAESPAIAETDVDLDLDDLTAALQVSEVGDTIEQPRDDATVEQPRPVVPEDTAEVPTMSISPEDLSDDLNEARTMTEVGTKLDLARAYVDMGDPAGARSILEEVLDEGDDGQKQQAQQLLDSLPS